MSDLWAQIDQLTERANGPEMTVHDLIDFVRMEGHEVIYATPGEITLDIDGTPNGVNPSTAGTATLSQVHLTSDQWETIARHLLTETEAS